MEVVTKNPGETYTAAQNFVESMLESKKKRAHAAVVALYGDLGSGKTTFTQGAAKALGITDTIISPTFVLERVYRLPPELFTNANEYKTNAFGKNSMKFGKHSSGFAHFIHIDCYRLESAKELLDLGWEEISKNPKNIIFVEWAEKVENLLPKDAVKIYFEHVSENERKIIVENNEL